jgi:hypothetical protein
VKRLVLAAILTNAALLTLCGSAYAQQDWSYAQERDDARRERAEQREEARRQRDEARRQRQEQREEWREERQDRWEEWRDRGGRRDGVHLRILRDYHLAAGATASEPIVIIGGSATIDGRAEQDVVVIGGTLRAGPTAVIGGDAVAVGGNALIDPSAQIAGDIERTTIAWPTVDFGWGAVPNGWWALVGFGAMVLRLGIILFVSLFTVWLAPGWIDRTGVRLSGAGGSSLVLGVVTQLLFVPALIVVTIALAITIVGIPLLLLLPFAVAGMGLLWVAGFAAVAVRIGARLRGQGRGPSHSPTLDLLTGFFATTIVTVAAHFLALGPSWMGPMAWMTGIVGFVVEYAVWTLGLGAALAAWLGGRQDTPPAIPIMPEPAPSTM